MKKDRKPKAEGRRAKAEGNPKAEGTEGFNR